MADKLSSKEHATILTTRITPAILDGKAAAVSQPRLVLLGGQPGAGKGGLRQNIKQSMAAPVEIDIDELRIYHTKYVAFVKENPSTAASRVQADCSEWAAELFAIAVKRRLNVIYDGTLSVSSKATGMAKDANKAGYGVEVHVVATSSDVSQQGVMERFEKVHDAWKGDKDNAPPPRSVPTNIQKSAYDNIPETLKDLCASGVVSRMRVGNRSGDAVCDLRGKAAVRRDGPKQATEALESERNRAWTETEIDEYKARTQEISTLMESRGVPKKDCVKLEQDQKAVADKRENELKAIQKKKDEWINQFVEYDVKDLAAQQPPPKKKKKAVKRKKRIDTEPSKQASSMDGEELIIMMPNNDIEPKMRRKQPQREEEPI